jgi:4-amino-4-deoxy-L-arabinose transferase-like glycosyltransferase
VPAGVRTVSANDSSYSADTTFSRSIFQSRAALAVIVFALLMWLPFIKQAFTIDDTNFLAMAAHAWPHPLALYDFHINWLGEEERAFDILGNPPVVPWYLALISTIARGREWVFHLSYWPFMVLTLAGAYRLGRRFAPNQDALWTVLWTAVAPAVVVSAHTIMPDLPLIACYVLGVALTIDAFDQNRPAFAIGGGFIAGCSALCRYSGMTVIPLLILYALLNRVRARTAVPAILAAVMPIAVWSLASYKQYGQPHWLAITGFETQSLDAGNIVHKLVYQCSSLALVIVPAALIVLLLNRALRRSIRIGAAVGLSLSIGLILEPWLPRLLSARAAVLLAIGLTGAGAIGVLIRRYIWGAIKARFWQRRGGPEADDMFLTCWVLGMLTFNTCFILFAAVRYILPALVPTVLLMQRALRSDTRSRRGWWLATGISFALAAVLSVSDQQFAGAYRDYAAALPKVTQQRWFTGHWGLQYYMESIGARPLSSTSNLQPGDEVVTPWVAVPQAVPKGVKLELIARKEMWGFPSLRTVTYEGAACFYSFGVVQGQESWIVWLPFGLTRAPFDVISRWKVVSTTP